MAKPKELIPNLMEIGVKFSQVTKGDYVELDEYTLKEAKKAKIENVVNAEESNQVISVYAADLLNTITMYEDVEGKLEDTERKVSQLQSDNVQLQEEATLSEEVTGKVNGFGLIMDQMEESLAEITKSHAVDRENQVRAEQERDRLAQENEDLKARIEQLERQAEENEVRYNELDSAYEELANEYEVVASDADQYQAGYYAIQEQVNNLINNLKGHLTKAGLSDFGFDFKE